MTGRPDIDLDAEWAAHRRAERWVAVLDIAALLGAGGVALAMPVWRWILTRALLGVSAALQSLDRLVRRLAKKARGPAPIPLLDRLDSEGRGR